MKKFYQNLNLFKYSKAIKSLVLLSLGISSFLNAQNVVNPPGCAVVFSNGSQYEVCLNSSATVQFKQTEPSQVYNYWYNVDGSETPPGPNQELDYMGLTNVQATVPNQLMTITLPTSVPGLHKLNVIQYNSSQGCYISNHPIFQFTYYVAPHSVAPFTNTSSNIAYCSLQQAIDVASNGQTIQIAPGNYDGDIVVNKQITFANGQNPSSKINSAGGIVMNGNISIISNGALNNLASITMGAGKSLTIMGAQSPSAAISKNAKTKMDSPSGGIYSGSGTLNGPVINNGTISPSNSTPNTN